MHWNGRNSISENADFSAISIILFAISNRKAMTDFGTELTKPFYKSCLPKVEFIFCKKIINFQGSFEFKTIKTV